MKMIISSTNIYLGTTMISVTRIGDVLQIHNIRYLASEIYRDLISKTIDVKREIGLFAHFLLQFMSESKIIHFLENFQFVPRQMEVF